MRKPKPLAEFPRAVLESLIESLEFAYIRRDLQTGPDGKACALTVAFEMGRVSLLKEIRLAVLNQEARADEAKQRGRSDG
jgi:hypothetical protein